MGKIITLYLIFIISLSASFIVNASDDPSIKIYGDGCRKCMDEYADELILQLNDLGYYDVEKRFIISNCEVKNELLAFKDELKVPKELRDGYLSVVIDEKYLFEGYVPTEIIVDFVDNHRDEYDNLVVSYDPILDLYQVLGNNKIINCQLNTSIANCVEPNEVRRYGTEISLILVSGFLDGINPCAFAVLLFFTALIISSVMPSNSSRGLLIKLGSSYIVGVFLSYLLIGIFLYRVISVFFLHNMVTLIGATILILAGLLNIKDYFLHDVGPSIRLSTGGWKIIKDQMRNVTVPASLISGMLVGFFEFPCTGAVYLTIISLISNGSNLLEGVKLLILYNIAFIFPLILVFLISILIDHDSFSLSKWKMSHEKSLKLFSGIVFILIGVLILYIDLMV